MSKRLNLVLLYGGKSGEHEVSLASAASVFMHLDRTRFKVIPIGMDKDGRFFLNDESSLKEYQTALPVEGPNAKQLPSLLKEGEFIVEADVIFPVVHGPLYEDGCLQGLLTLANTAFVGCDVLSSALGMDKDMARRIACRGKIQSTQYAALSWFADAKERDVFCHEVIQKLGFPLFVKPCSLGSSVGTHKVESLEALKLAIEDARKYDKEVLVEAFLHGREVEVAVLENPKPNARPRVSMPGEVAVHHPDGFYSYRAKYLESEQTELLIPAPLSAELTREIQEAAAEIFTALKCQGLARVDFFVDEQNHQIYFNEINTMPGFTSISMYPKMWEASGIGYVNLLNELVDLALIHQACRKQLVTHYQ